MLLPNNYLLGDFCHNDAEKNSTCSKFLFHFVKYLFRIHMQINTLYTYPIGNHLEISLLIKKSRIIIFAEKSIQFIITLRSCQWASVSVSLWHFITMALPNDRSVLDRESEWTNGSVKRTCADLDYWLLRHTFFLFKSN